MKLIVNIDEKDYNRVKKGKLSISVFNACVYAIENGTPLDDKCNSCIYYPTETEDD